MATSSSESTVTMSEVTPTKAPYRQLDVSGTLDPDDDDSDGLPRNGSRTPGSPTKCGGRTMWTKDEDEDEIPSISGMDAESGSAPVVTQVTQSADLEAPRYHASTRPTSFRRARVGSIGRGPRRRGFLGSLLCCFRAQETDGDGKVGTPRDTPATIPSPPRPVRPAQPRAVVAIFANEPSRRTTIF